MLWQTPTVQWIRMLFLASFFTTSSLSAASFSTVSPHIQVAAGLINEQVTSGMNGAAQQINTIKNNADNKLKAGYEKKQTKLENIKKLQAESLSLMMQIESEHSNIADLRSTAVKIDSSATESSIQSTEKTAISTAIEQF